MDLAKDQDRRRITKDKVTKGSSLLLAFKS